MFDFDALADIALNEPTPSFELIKTVFPSWDNDARRQGTGLTVANSTPQSYERWLRRTIEVSGLRPFRGERYVFINAWNEWCEGAYLEPDVHFGSAYLNATARAVCRSLVSEGIHKAKVVLVGHDAFPAGAQLLLLNIARMFAESFGVETRVLLLGGGELLPSYEQVCPVTVCAFSRLRACKIFRTAMGRLKVIAHWWRWGALDVGDQALMRGLDTAVPRCVRGFPYLTAGVDKSATYVSV